MTKLCCILNKAIHSNWKGDEQFYCINCATDLLTEEYGDDFRRKHKNSELGDRLRKDFSFFHPVQDCSKACS
jgi:hypothetical protein